MVQVRGLSRHRCLGRLVRDLVADEKLPVVLRPQLRDARAGTALARTATRARSFMQEFPRWGHRYRLLLLGFLEPCQGVPGLEL